ncbi:MAG: sulfatase-like hydrolase/transferase [Verrucomicrobiae bacterium]|nr:sulfatase-like hydrolase/transferase [Verrucomicrobiae bacterium]NNJ87643.1 sulfatase-like hydrolase/transferase [Akkermansiaceae bacterium]
MTHRYLSITYTAFLLVGLFNAVVSAGQNRPPNIIVILADDLGYPDISLCDGWVSTPRIDQLASEGMTLTDFHSNSSVCSPTRAAFLTGRYQQRVGIVDVIVGAKEPYQGLKPATTTFAKVLKKHDYATAIFGKWHLGYQDRYNPLHHGFDEFVGFLTGGADYHQHAAWRNGLKQQKVSGYSTDIITGKSVDFIKRHPKTPFFLYVAHQTPHNPYQTRDDTPENRPEGWKQNRVNDINRPRYKQLVKDLDTSVGAILDAVIDTGLAENTLVFFWSDNGDVRMAPVNRPMRGGKFSLYEGGHRVPAVAWWPGHIKAGSKSDQLLAGFDLFPTFTDIIGISKDNPDKLDGISARSILLGKGSGVTTARDLFFGYEPKLGTAMRRGDWKLIVKGKDLQLYNLKTDPKETTNIAAKHPGLTKSMRQAVKDFKQTVVPGS